jgi:hypothetical protein
VPVFILGCQRSGTTICQEVFLRSRRIAVYSEGNKEAMTSDWRLRPYADIQRLIDRSKAGIALFKPLNDSQSALQILELFDDSCVIWIYRNFYDTANSAVALWGPAQRDMVVWIGEALAKFGCVEKAMPAILDKPSYAVYAERLSAETSELLIEWVSNPITEHTGAAIMWYLRNQLYFEQKLDTNERSLLINYEKFVASPNAQIGRMCKIIDTRNIDVRSRNVFATSVGRNKAPDISPTVVRACEGLFNRLNKAEQSGPWQPEQDRKV